MNDSVRILWLDPDAATVAEPSRALTGRGWTVDVAGTVQDAIALARHRLYHFAIVNVVLPDGVGTEAWGRLKRLLPDLRGIMTTSSWSLRATIQAFEPGVLAYLTKPLAMDDVCGLIATVCEYPMSAGRDSQNGEPRNHDEAAPGAAPAAQLARHESVLAAPEEQETIADRASGLYSAAFLDHVLAMESARQTREFCPYSLILVDWSGVRQAYEALGPEVAAGALRSWGGLARRVVRKSDVVARRRGDEFVILLPNADFVQAQLVAQRIEAHTAAALPEAARRAHPVLTFHFVTYPPNQYQPPKRALVPQDK